VTETGDPLASGNGWWQPRANSYTSRASRRRRWPRSHRPPACPPGNVYYYFKTKDEIIAAVVEARVQETLAMTAALERRHRTPKARLKALVAAFAQQGETVARHGCPLGTLCSELDKRATPPDPAVARLMRIPIEWAEGQFRLMGRTDAHELAFDLIANYEGTALLTNTFGDPEQLAREARRLERWIDSVD
jgi:AcrR family transcriptional regulator